ncbi:hypothetical protein Rsub_02346 [Raphidocelis subcapitata]|uniref:Fe2OG dioxygenase domain-containing protein n=1 Tax=Raphidocelis subcapitata TaxID=307507 RepID=A0A2V0NPR8_9CHLO|nr:hypothetical protein Rsub_02346 [Raphidocelis subcapitata]|eukprot:GBF89628.1 hypothetical protein Rsub_02346 [Raphidocelis subcapitata]
MLEKPLAALAALCLLAGALGRAPPGEDAFVGWLGDASGGHQLHDRPAADPPSRTWVRTLSWAPRAFAFHGFLSDEECEHIKRLAAPQMKRSMVFYDGGNQMDDYRTSFGAFISRRCDYVIARVGARVADWVRIPETHAEDMQVLRYGPDQFYEAHMDTLDDDVWGPRLATVLLYLSDVEEGGETAFRGSGSWADPGLPAAMGPASNCTRGGVAFKPKKGDALLFWSVQPDGTTEDPASLHAGCPVLAGVKWVATIWIRARPFKPDAFEAAEEDPPDPGLCIDASPHCKEWAAVGRCEANPVLMVGAPDAPGSCRNACRACPPCPPPGGGAACYNFRRRAAGFLEAAPSEAHLFPAAASG